ncbi:MAG TPA: hypothetical protein VFA39_15785 [Steroidobacteraceae bacterium]|nr:hypothetical protein [Steroidobacteraceae bacterium]
MKVEVLLSAEEDVIVELEVTREECAALLRLAEGLRQKRSCYAPTMSVTPAVMERGNCPLCGQKRNPRFEVCSCIEPNALPFFPGNGV